MIKIPKNFCYLIGRMNLLNETLILVGEWWVHLKMQNLMNFKSTAKKLQQTNILNPKKGKYSITLKQQCLKEK